MSPCGRLYGKTRLQYLEANLYLLHQEHGKANSSHSHLDHKLKHWPQIEPERKPVYEFIVNIYSVNISCESNRSCLSINVITGRSSGGYGWPFTFVYFQILLSFFHLKVIDWHHQLNQNTELQLKSFENSWKQVCVYMGFFKWTHTMYILRVII